MNQILPEEKKQKELVFRPFRQDSLIGCTLSVFFIVISMGFFLFAISLETITNSLMVLSIVFCIFILFWGILFYHSLCKYHTVISCDQNGIEIVNDAKNTLTQYTWNVFSHGYYRRNLKGWNYIILSPCELELAWQKTIISQIGFWKRIQIDSTVVIELSEDPESLSLREIIHDNIPNIHGHFI